MNKIWTETLSILKGGMSQASYDFLLSGTQLSRENGSYQVHCTSSQAMENLEYRFKPIVETALSTVVNDTVSIEFVAKEYYEPEVEPEPSADGDYDIDFDGVYHDKRNAIIQPDKVVVFSQYFRRKWFRLLKPAESLLVIELRQRCHFKSNRNTCQATYKELAESINVSEITIKRLLAKDNDGEFKSKYLGMFIKSIETIKTSNGYGKVRNCGSKFVIYLDDPLTPGDTEKLSQNS